MKTNCYTCAHNRYERAGADLRDFDMINRCAVVVPDDDKEPNEATAASVQAWTDKQLWDDEMMCLPRAFGCPGWASRA